MRQWALFSAPMAAFSRPMAAFSWPNGRFLAHQWALLKQVALRIGVDPIPHEFVHGAGCVLRSIVVSSRYVSPESDADTKHLLIT